MTCDFVELGEVACDIVRVGVWLRVRVSVEDRLPLCVTVGDLVCEFVTVCVRLGLWERLDDCEALGTWETVLVKVGVAVHERLSAESQIPGNREAWVH